MTDPAIQALLEARARALARVPPAQELDDGADFVVVTLGPERYGVPLKLVREIRPCERVTPIPGTPPFWFGLANLRGRLYPVLDLARFLALPANSAVQNQKLVLVAAAGLEVCLLIDDVLGVQRIRDAELGALLAETNGQTLRTRNFACPYLAQNCGGLDRPTNCRCLLYQSRYRSAYASPLYR